MQFVLIILKFVVAHCKKNRQILKNSFGPKKIKIIKACTNFYNTDNYIFELI